MNVPMAIHLEKIPQKQGGKDPYGQICRWRKPSLRNKKLETFSSFVKTKGRRARSYTVSRVVGEGGSSWSSLRSACCGDGLDWSCVR